MNDEGIDDILNQLMVTSLGLYQANHPPPLENWKVALALEAQGWSIIRHEPSPEKEQAIVLVFSKDGIEKPVILGYTDQQRWFDFILKRGEDSDESNK